MGTGYDNLIIPRSYNEYLHRSEIANIGEKIGAPILLECEALVEAVRNENSSALAAYKAQNDARVQAAEQKTADVISGIETVAKAAHSNESEYAQKIGTSASHPAIGSKSVPVYINSDGMPTPCDKLETLYCPFPVGATYTQYPAQKSPIELWTETTWELLDYGGAFFRSTGGNADNFVESGALVAQEDMIKYHESNEMSKNATGGFRGNNTESFGSEFHSGYGNISISGSSGVVGKDIVQRGGRDTVTINVQHTHSYGNENVNIETRPKNFTCCIWKRTA